MLTELHIEDLGVIDRLDLVLGRGLTALTGETGAGKTMLVEAINLLVGGRADGSIVRPGADQARVEGRFVVDDEEIVLARVVPRDGRSRAYVNGRLATVATLAEEGVRLVDLHGQHAHQSLLATATQRAALDRFGAVDLTPLRAARQRLHDIDTALAGLGGDSRARAREIDLLRFQVDEIEAAALTGDDEEQRLEAEEDLLAGAAADRAGAAAAVEMLTGDGGIADVLRRVGTELNGRARFEAAADRVAAALAELDDVGRDLRLLAETIEDDSARLDAIGARRQQLRDLRRKYGDTLSEVMRYLDEQAARLAELEGYEARAAALDAQRARALDDIASAAADVAAARRAAAPRLATKVRAHLRELAMPHATLAVEVGADDPGDDVSFLLAANPGSPLAPLTKVASGGELARSMLALRLVLREAPGTLVFDEVDAGVGGSAAVAIGRALARLGEGHQVLVVTHLPQVAALATAQVVVAKHVAKGSTRATATPVTADDRVEEIARMLSGQAGSESARAHAMELLADGARLDAAG